MLIPLLLRVLSAATPAGAQDSGASLGVVIGGIAFYDFDGDGSRDPTEPGVPGIKVQVRACTNERMGSLRTDSAGEFSVTLATPGCFYLRMDVSANEFTDDGDVNPQTGRTGQSDLMDGEAKYWYAAIVPPQGVTSPTGSPTNENTSSPSTSLSPTAPLPTDAPSPRPATSLPSAGPSSSRAPSSSPTSSSAPTACEVRETISHDIMSSAPIMRSTYGAVFRISTPPLPRGARPPGERDVVRITSLSLRAKLPLAASMAGYQVWYRPGDYSGVSRGDLTGWTLLAEGNSMGGQGGGGDGGASKANGGNGTTQLSDTLIPDTNFLSGAFPSDNNDYKALPSTPLSDGGMETLNIAGDPVRTYLYRIPESIFVPVHLPSLGGKGALYVTLDKKLMQLGDADESEWDDVDVENSRYSIYDVDGQNGMNVRVHVGEGVTSYPWSDVANFYSPRRFLGKIWYERIKYTPCLLHETAPSSSPTLIVIPPLPFSDVEAGGREGQGENIESRLVVSVFLQLDINEAVVMDDDVVRYAFGPTVLDFLNVEWVFRRCVWATSLVVTHQRLSLLDLERVRRRLQRQLLRGRDLLHKEMAPSVVSLFTPSTEGRRAQTDITVLRVEVLVGGVVYDDPGVCPNGAAPTSATDRGRDWDETMAIIGSEHIKQEADKLAERLRLAHEYFGDIFAVSADDKLLTQKRVVTSKETGTGSFPLIPVLGAAAALLLIIFIVFSYIRCRKQGKERKNEPRSTEDKPEATAGQSETPKELVEFLVGMNKGKKGDGQEQAPEVNGDADGCILDRGVADSPFSLSKESLDPLTRAEPRLRRVPQLEEIIMMRGLPRRRSEPDMGTEFLVPNAITRIRSIGSIREIWTNLNSSPFSSYGNNAELGGAYFEELLNGELYPTEDPDVLYFEREKHLAGEDGSSPYVPHGRNIRYNFIDEDEAFRIESPRSQVAEGKESIEVNRSLVAHNKKVNPLVMQQVEMLEAKWKQLRDEYDDEGEYSDDYDGDDVEGFDVNARIEQLMGHIEKLELDRKMRLAELKRQEEEEEELARRRMVKAGEGINYDQEFNKELVIRKKTKKKKKIQEDVDEEEFSSSEEEVEEGGEFDVKWMRLKVPLAAQNPETMQSMVKKGRNMEGDN